MASAAIATRRKQKCGSVPARARVWFVTYADASRLNSLLSQICIERGWCLSPDGYERVRQAIPDGINAVVDTIICIELETDPVLCDKHTRRWLRGKVDDWLFDPQGRGVSSGLPL